MTFAFLVAAFLATAGPARGRLALVALGVCAAAIAFAGELLDVLSIGPESWRIAAGLVLAAAGLSTFARPAPRAAGVPPDLLVFAVAAGADETTGKAIGALALALAASLAVARAPAPLYTGRLLAALEVAVGVSLVVSGIRDV